jgi:hypothetical protein
MRMSADGTTLFIRLPHNLQKPIEGGCQCEYCKQRAIDTVPMWDALAVSTKTGESHPIHCPELFLETA